ncbi:MAG: GyrI-like domain-containing protein [Cellulomonas sp.]
MKIDFKKTLDSYQARRGEFRILEIPERQYLMLDGHGDPNTSTDFTDAIEALYPLAYGLKFASKNDLDQDYVVAPLEGLWWAESELAFTSDRDKSAWSWTLLLLVPDWITPTIFRAVREQALTRAATKDASPRLGDVRLETLDEGRCVQTLHAGSFETEGPTLDAMHHNFIPAHGLRMTGKHHEIYLSDFRRVQPDKLRTVLRQSVLDA